MIDLLKARGYPSDPVKAWKQSFKTDEEEEEEQEEDGTSAKGGPDYKYLLSMQLLSLTKEEKEKLLKNRDKKVCTSVSSHVSLIDLSLARGAEDTASQDT